MRRSFIGTAIHRFGRKGVILAAGAALTLTALIVPASASPGRAPGAIPASPRMDRDPGVFPSLAREKEAPPAPGSVVISSTRFGDGDRGGGRVLVDGSGSSLYEFSGDGLPQLACLPTNVAANGTPCTTAWPPLLATGPVVAGPGVDPGLIGTVNRPGIGNQVTYAGMPLYHFIKDTAPGQMNGQDVTAFLGIFRLVSVRGIPEADENAAVNLELSPAGPVLDAPVAGSTRSLYVLSADPAGQTSCTGQCAAVWPPLLTDDAPIAGPGVNQAELGVLPRPDGTLQVTYNGRPIYLFSFDLATGAPSGETLGDNFIDPPAFGVWDSLAADGLPATPPITVTSETTSSGSTVLAVDGNNTPLGSPSATAYTFSGDTATSSACNGACANAWPPVLTSAPPVAGPGTDASKLGTIQRSDGSFQVTYGSQPLYLFSHALDSTTNGAGITAFGGTFSTVPAP